MKVEKAFPVSVATISGVIIIWGAIKGCLTSIIPCPMWVLIIIFAIPFLLYVVLGYILGRVKRKFKIGDLVQFVNSTEELVVIDYVRFNPFVVVVQAKQQNNVLIMPHNFNRLDPRVNIKYLVGINPVSQSEVMARYCTDKGIKPIEMTMDKI